MAIQWGKICGVKTAHPDRIEHINKIIRMITFEYGRKPHAQAVYFIAFMLSNLCKNTRKTIQKKIKDIPADIIVDFVSDNPYYPSVHLAWEYPADIHLRLSIEGDFSIDEFLELSHDEKIHAICRACKYYNTLLNSVRPIVLNALSKLREISDFLECSLRKPDKCFTGTDLLESIAGHTSFNLHIEGTLSENAIICADNIKILSKYKIEIAKDRVTVHIELLDLLKLMSMLEEDYVVLPVRHVNLISVGVGEYERREFEFWRYNHKYKFWRFAPLIGDEGKPYRTKYNVYVMHLINSSISSDLPKLWGLFKVVKETEKSIWLKPVDNPRKVAEEWFKKTFPKYNLIIQ